MSSRPVKCEFSPAQPPPSHAMYPRWRSPRVAIILALLFLAGLWHIRSVHITNLVSQVAARPQWDIATKADLAQQSLPLSTAAKTSAKPIPLEAHIMSKCPDARDCLVDLVVPAMSRLDPSHVNFTLSYIGVTTDHDDVECRHGPDECLGNILQLCAAQLYPDPKQYLGFAYCTIKRLEDIPHRALIQECAAEYGIEFSRLNDCASKNDGSLGTGLLRDSVTRTKDAGVTLSCTVRVNEKIWCIRDGGEWSDCKGGDQPEDLVKVIEKLYHEQTK